MVQLSRAATGGGVASAVARALGSAKPGAADAVGWHGMSLVFGFGPIPPFGIAGASLSFVLLNAVFACVLLWSAAPCIIGESEQ